VPLEGILVRMDYYLRLAHLSLTRLHGRLRTNR
jgi:hypothetical protein